MAVAVADARAKPENAVFRRNGRHAANENILDVFILKMLYTRVFCQSARHARVP